MSNSALDVIEAMGLSTTSFVQAVQVAKHDEKLHLSSLEQCRMLISEISGQTEFDLPTERFARTLLMYVIQETVRAGMCDDEVFQIAVDATKRFLVDYRFTYAYLERAEAPTYNEDGSVKRKKGEKKVMAETIYKELVAEHSELKDKAHDGDAKAKRELKKLVMTALQEQVGMTKAGSQTYFYNSFKKFGR